MYTPNAIQNGDKYYEDKYKRYFGTRLQKKRLPPFNAITLANYIAY